VVGSMFPSLKHQTSSIDKKLHLTLSGSFQGSFTVSLHDNLIESIPRI
jgi:hypothetical protein